MAVAKHFREIMEAFRKSGEFSPEVINVGGVLTPEQSNSFIDLAVSGSPILSRVTVDRSRKLTKDVDVYSLLRRVLQRVPQGSGAAEFTSFQNVGKRLDMKSAQLFARILFDFLRDNQDRPNLEQLVNARLSKGYGDDVALLAFTGIADDYDPADPAKKVFERLNEGWPQLAKAASGSHKVPVADHQSGTPAVTNWSGLLGAMVAALPNVYKGSDTVFIMSRSDAELYQQQIGGIVGGLSYLLKREDLSFLGYEVVALNEMPSGTVLLTPLANLVWGVNTEVERYREVSGEKRCITYTFDSSFDFQIALDDAVVVAS